MWWISVQIKIIISWPATFLINLMYWYWWCFIVIKVSLDLFDSFSIRIGGFLGNPSTWAGENSLTRFFTYRVWLNHVCCAKLSIQRSESSVTCSKPATCLLLLQFESWGTWTFHSPLFFLFLFLSKHSTSVIHSEIILKPLDFCTGLEFFWTY